MTATPASILSDVLRTEPDAVMRLFAEAVEALVGKKVEVDAIPIDSPDLSPAFGDRELYLFPFENHSGQPLPMFLALDVPAAVHTGAAFSLMGPEQVREVLSSGEIPEILGDSIGEVANIIAGSVGKFIQTRAPSGTPEFRRGSNSSRTHVGQWPAVLGEIDKTAPWEIAGARIRCEGEETGAVLFGSSDGKKGRIRLEQPAAAAETDEPVDDDAEESPGDEPAADARAGDDAPKPEVAVPPGLKVQVTGNPADRAMVALRSCLEEAGVQPLPMYSSSGSSVSQHASALFVVSRSPIDLRSRLDALSGSLRRPPLVVACSDRPTLELVKAARLGGADQFLVLPTSAERLASVFSSLAAPVA